MIELKSISKTKFHRLIFKDALFKSKIGEDIIIHHTSEDMLNIIDLFNEIDICSLSKVRIERLNDKIIVTKIKPLLEEGDNINKWSFCIITKGDKNDWMENLIQSIRNQNIPEYEILVCGTYYDRKEDDIRYIPFSEKDDSGWITKKKNLLCQEAKYENLCMLHDRIVLTPGWFEGMKKYGNDFEVLGCIVKDKYGNRVGDWTTYGCEYKGFPYIGNLQYQDWDKWGYLDGGFWIIKRNILLKCPLNEELFLNQSEDYELSRRLYINGYVTRINTNAEAITVNWRHGMLPIYSYDEKKLGEYPNKQFHLIHRTKRFIKQLLGRSGV